MSLRVKPIKRDKGTERWVVDDVKENGKWKTKYLKNCGYISQKKAEQEKNFFEKQLEIKPIYRTIVIDPPWPMKKIPRKVRPNQKGGGYDGRKKGKTIAYHLMSIEDIKKFPLQKFVSKDGAHIYLWTTHKYLPTAFQILNSWGVNYQCTLTWVKNVGITPFSFMYSTEFVLFGQIGNLSLIRKGIRTDFKAKVQGHSVKPDEFYKTVRRVSPEPRIDIFNRRKIEGFDSYGYEAGKFDN